MTMIDIIEFIKSFPVNKIDPKYVSYIREMGCDARMTGAGVIQILNTCVSMMSSGYYLEVGTWCGSTLCGASMGNKNLCIGIDNFSEFQNPDIKNRLEKNMSKWAPNAQFIEGEYESVFATLAQKKEKVQVYWYDGSHKEGDHANGILLAKPLLADQSIILVDDVSKTDCGRLKKFRKYSVYEEMRRFLSENNTEFTLIRHFPQKGANAFHEGIISILFSRKESGAE